MSARSDAVARLDAGQIHFRALIADLPAEAYGETWLGSWNLSQLLAHMAGWFREMTGAIDRVSRGEKPTPDGVDYADAEPWNAKFAAQAKAGVDALAEWDAAYAEYRAAALRLPEELYGVDPEKGRPRIGDRLLQGAGIGHFEEHEGELSAWVSSRSRP